MKKKKLLLFCIVVLSFIQVLVVASPVLAISEAKKEILIGHCETIKDSLRNVQKSDARTRIYLGGYYEIILSKFMTPLNVRLVENNLSTGKLIENQNQFAEARALFVADFVTYQQALEELVGTNCKSDPEMFSEKLERVQLKRQVVEQDTLKLRDLLSEHVKLVLQLKEKI